jgi:hypothetical protein
MRHKPSHWHRHPPQLLDASETPLIICQAHHTHVLLQYNRYNVVAVVLVVVAVFQRDTRKTCVANGV